MVRKVEKDCWEGSRQIEHLGFQIDRETVKVYVRDRKVHRVRVMARHLISSSNRNQFFFSADAIRHFCGVCDSLSLAVPLSRFLTRSLYFELSSTERTRLAQSPQRDGGGASASESCRSGTQTLRDLSGVYRGSVSLGRQSLRDLKW